MFIQDFEIGTELGKGAFASVIIAKRKADGKNYAIKRVKIAQLKKKERDNALNEVRILASITHNNIIGFKETFFDENTKTLNIVMEYADDGDLEAKIKFHSKNKTNFDESYLWSVLIQMLQGLKALHDNKIMHRDIKSANVFLTKENVVKLGDLNVSKIIKQGMNHTQTGTPYYASPEVWADKPYDYKSDIWSVGCIFYEMACLKPPFRAESLKKLFKVVTKGVYDPIPTIYSSELMIIIGMMLQVNPQTRPSAESLLSNPILLKRMEDSYCLENNLNSKLLNTIKFPQNLGEINEKLPKKRNYEL